MADGFWTPERTDALRRMQAQGRTDAQIATGLKTTRNAVRGKAHRLAGYKYTKPKKRPTPSFRPEKIDRGDWDAKLFESWQVRKQRLAHERNRNEMGS